MSGGPQLDSGGSGGGDLEDYLGDLAATHVADGKILYAKLLGTVLGSIWLVLVGGWITVTEVIVNVHVHVLNTIQAQLVRVIDAIFGDGADLITASWGATYRAAVETEPILAPLTLVVEVVLTWLLLDYLREQSGVI